MRAALVFVRDATEHRFELTDQTTIGRGADCELQLADERISTRHCRVSRRHDLWWIEDLGSTNRTYVNGDLVAEQRHRLCDGDVVRLGAADIRLFEARFVLRAVSEARHRAAEPAADGARRHAEIEAQLAARDAEIGRLRAMCKRLQAQVADGEIAALAAQRIAARMAAEIDELTSQLAIERNEHAASRDHRDRAEQRIVELEAVLTAQERKARRDLDDGERGRRDLESRLRMADSELATARVALAAATDNVRTLQQAHADALIRLDAAAREPADP